jgi:hypothetical protein
MNISHEQLEINRAIYDDDQLECLLHLHSPLEEQHPEEFERYLELFYRYQPKRPYNVRTAYDRGFIQQNRQYRHQLATYPLYCHAGLIARHLDYDHWAFLNPDKKRTERFWLAMWAPKRSKVKALDIDNKQNLLGYTQSRDGPLYPVVRIPLDRFMELKRIYDGFPGHVWCISSETLGLHLWEKYPQPVAVADIHKFNRPKLKRLGITAWEIHPMLGRCFRRPFGQDYHTITERGLLSNWIDQLTFFERDASTPSFPAIVRELRDMLLAQWDMYDRCRGPSRDRRQQTQRIDTGGLRRELEEIDAWAASGFQIDAPAPAEVFLGIGGPASPAGKQAVPPGSSCDLTLSDVCSGEWVQNCESWAISGLPCEDSLFLVVSQLARWFYFIELFRLPEDQRIEKIKRLLVHFAMTKHNGFISRLAGGLEEEVAAHVTRAIESGIANADITFKGYCVAIRQKRDQGRYKRVICLEGALCGKDDHFLSSSRWVYMCSTKEADSTPLPEPLINGLLDAYRETGRLPRKNRSTGNYPVVEKCTAFVNALYNNGGKGRLGQETMKQFGFCSDHQRELLKKVMVKAGIITTGSYRSQAASRLYRLTDKTIRELDEKRKPRQGQHAG